ncbi:MAG: beta-galactosidase trimerization domain-containing protein, partial [Verrucomicrobiota bacterium]|nr:beta-galactosidase trimerization domain-containing protein [Verrucomicrobiota bacterium]
MDALNDGQWNFTGNGKYRAAFAVKEANGKLTPIAAFDGEGALKLAADADTRYSRRLRQQEDVLFDLLAEVKKEPLRGRLPTETLIYGYTFASGLGSKYDRAVTEFRKMFALQDTSLKDGTYIDVRSVPTAKLEEYCKNLGSRTQHIRCVSLGDEISLPKPPGGVKGTAEMVNWLQRRGLKPKDILPGATNWDAIKYDPTDAAKTARSGVYYWSRRYQHHFGIQAIKNRTNILRKHLPNAGIGANYSPHYPDEHRYLGEVHKWVTIFREEGMTQPWSEDYIFQMPVATQQMNNINLDLLRAGVRGKPEQKIHYYCMPHWPGQIPENWRRLFYGALGHGMQVVNLFEFRPVHAAYTENHCSNPETYRTVLRSFRELGMFEDIIQSGRKRPAKAALWFSETADIWSDNHGSFAAGKRTLYSAIIHQGTPLDFVIENGNLKNYRVLFLTDAHVSRRDSESIAAWVKAGGSLFATAGAGMFDELNQPNTILRGVLGVSPAGLDAPASSFVGMVKQELPFAAPVDEIAGESGDTPVYGARSRVKLAGAKAQLKFKSGTPALTLNTQGRGQAQYAAFLPGLTYFAPGTPKVPVDRGTTAQASAHFIPIRFDAATAKLLQFANVTAANPVKCSEPLVEANIIDSPKGSVVILANWNSRPIKELEIQLPADLTKKKLSVASGASYQKNGNVVRMDLKVADALILR